MNNNTKLVELITSKIKAHPEKVSVTKGFGDQSYVVTYEGIRCNMTVNYNSVMPFPNFSIFDVVFDFSEVSTLYYLVLPFIKEFKSNEKDDKLEELIKLWED